MTAPWNVQPLIWTFGWLLTTLVFLATGHLAHARGHVSADSIDPGDTWIQAAILAACFFLWPLALLYSASQLRGMVRCARRGGCNHEG